MNKAIITSLVVLSFLFANVQLYWDLGIGITDFSVNNSKEDLITLSTFNRIEGLKKYYNHDFEGAIYHFSQLEPTHQLPILYEHIHSYYSINKP